MFIVAWHEANATGVPEHVMGAKAFRTKGDAARWIAGCIAEDRERARLSGDTFHVLRRGGRRSVDDVYAVTCTPVQTTYYEIAEETGKEIQ